MKFNTLILGITIVLFSCQSDEVKEATSVAKGNEELPMREIKTTEELISVIKADSAWLFMVTEKAKDQNIPLDQMLKIDAEFMKIQDAEIVKIENDIIRNPEWLKTVKQKALEQKISVDDMIRIDATFMYDESKKLTNDTINNPKSNL